MLDFITLEESLKETILVYKKVKERRTGLEQTIRQYLMRNEPEQLIEEFLNIQLKIWNMETKIIELSQELVNSSSYIKYRKWRKSLQKLHSTETQTFFHKRRAQLEMCIKIFG